jgi:hypothetical protein
MSTYLWKQRPFWDDVEKEIKIEIPKKIIISSAYLSLKGVEYLQNLSEISNLKRGDIIVYCSSIDFHDTKPVDILKVLYSFTSVFLVVQPFLQTCVFFRKRRG